MAGSLWAATALAQDAGAGDAGGVDASAVDGGAPGGSASKGAGELVYPPPGGTEVVLNAGLLVRISLATLEDARSSRSAFDAGLLVRDDAGGLVALGPIVALDTPRTAQPSSVFASSADRSAPVPLPNSRVELATPPLALSPGRRYEVLSRMATCPTDGLPNACLGDEYVSIGAFTTGTELDSKAPVFESATLGDSPGTCLAALTLIAADDHAAPNAVRFTTDMDGYLGPDLVLRAPNVPTQEGLATVRLIPIDPSGNRGAPFEVEVDGCPNVPTDYYLPPEVRPPTVSNNGGCAFVPMSGLGEVGGLGVGALTALLALVRRRARGTR